MLSPYFSETLKALIGYSISIFSNDGILMKGSLVEVKEDYLILQNEQGEHFYHHLNQIKSISKNTKDIQTNKINRAYMQAEKLQEILEQCKRRWVTINYHTDQVLTGFLSKVFDDHLILISGEEKVIMQNSYISTIFSGFYEKDDAITKDELTEKELSVNSELEVISELTEKEVSANSELEVISDLNETSAANEMNETAALDALQPDNEIEQKEGLEDDQVELVSSSTSEASEEIAKEMTSFTADSTLLKKQAHKYPVTEEIEEIDYTLFDQKLRSNLVARKKKGQMPQNEEESKPAAKSKKNIYYDSENFSRLKDGQFQKCRTSKRIKCSKKNRRLQAEEKQSVTKTTVQVAEEKQDLIQPVWTQEEKEKVLETQYYALMKQAEKFQYYSLMKQAEKSQYYSLMKQAENDYMKLKEKRMQRERIKQ